MEIAGIYTFAASADQVWEKLMNPEVLSSCLPGVESLEAQGEDQYDATVSLGVGPIRGHYSAKISIRDINPLSSYRLLVEGSGSLGFANGEALISLAEQEGVTSVNIQGDAQVGGSVARVGQRMMGSVAQGILDRFMGCVQEALGSNG